MHTAPTARQSPPTEHGARVDTVYRPTFAVDLVSLVARNRQGTTDPTVHWDGDICWRGVRTPRGVGSIALRQESGAIRASAWGPGAEWLIDQLPDFCGASDDADGFDPSLHPLIARAAREIPAQRLGRTDTVVDVLMSTILGQKVTAVQAYRAWKSLVHWHGERAPGPRARLWAAPTYESWRAIPSWDWHRAGVEPPQSRAAVNAAALGDSWEVRVRGASGQERESLLVGVRGIGVWTAAEVRSRSFGDPDAVAFGDYHLAHDVGYALTGKRVDDDTMAELLEPWSGHRARVIQVIYAAGLTEPRRGARLHPEDHRDR